MDDIWLCVEEDGISSLSSADSDNVDSEIEAELYGMIHHEDNLPVAADYFKDKNSVIDQISDLSNSNNIHIGDDLCKIKDNIPNFIKSCKAESQCAEDSSNPNPVNQKSFKKNTSTPFKRKSDSEQDSVRVIVHSDGSEEKNTNLLSKHTLSNGNINKKPCYNLQKKPSLLNKNSTNISDSSDSDDSVIWTERDSSVKSDLKMNLSNDIDTISIISDSSNDSFMFYSPSRRKELTQKKLSLPQIKLGENSTDIWHINDEDYYRSKRKSRRYHNNNDIHCNNCGQKGHIARVCAIPKVVKCFICGGPHVGFDCKNRICSKCYSWGHHNRHCKFNFFAYCCHCRMKGHSKKDCPDIWRRYHLTTELVSIVPGKRLIQDKTMYCFNCGLSGHSGAACKEPRNNKGTLPTWPSVISYDNPDEFTDSQRNARSSFAMDTQENQMQQTYGRVKTEGIQHTHPYESVKSEKKKVKKKWEQFRQKKKILKEKDFPRTPIKAEINQFEDPIPDCISIAMKKQIKNRRRRIRQKQKKSSENIFKTKVSKYTDLLNCTKK